MEKGIFICCKFRKTSPGKEYLRYQFSWKLVDVHHGHGWDISVKTELAPTIST
jgi:hypothetical protein